MERTGFEVSYTSEGVFVDGHQIPNDKVGAAMWYSPAAVKWENGSLTFGEHKAYLQVDGFHYEFPGHLLNQFGTYYL